MQTSGEGRGFAQKALPHPRSLPGCPPDQLRQRPWLQPEGLVIGAQPTDGRLRGHQGCDSAVGRKSDTSTLHVVTGRQEE